MSTEPQGMRLRLCKQIAELLAQREDQEYRICRWDHGDDEERRREAIKGLADLNRRIKAKLGAYKAVCGDVWDGWEDVEVMAAVAMTVALFTKRFSFSDSRDFEQIMEPEELPVLLSSFAAEGRLRTYASLESHNRQDAYDVHMIDRDGLVRLVTGGCDGQ